MVDLIYNLIYLLAMAVFVAAVWWGTARLMDRAAGVEFRDEIEKISTSPSASALYFGLRLVALAILFHSLLRVLL